MQAEHVKKDDLFTAVKHLAETEVELIKVIENSSKCQRTGNMPANTKKMKKPGKSGNVIIIHDFYNILLFCIQYFFVTVIIFNQFIY